MKEVCELIELKQTARAVDDASYINRGFADTLASLTLAGVQQLAVKERMNPLHEE